MKYSIRESTSQDLALVGSLFFCKINNNSKIFIAESAEKIIGYIEFQYIFEDAEILNIEVLKEFQEQKIATKLIQHTENYLIKNNVKKIFLEVRTTNQIAINLYKKFNFEKIDVRKNYYKNPICDAIIMKKELNQFNRQIFCGHFKTGKTQILIKKYLEVPPSKAIFFAVNERKLEKRIIPQILQNTQTGFEDLWIDNFSSFCKKLLRKHHHILGLPKDFKVLSGFEQKLIINKILKDSKLNSNVLIDLIDNLKLYPNKNFELNHEIKQIYDEYQNELKKSNFLDYRDLNIKTLKLFENPKILEFYQNKFEHVFIDDLEEITNLDFLVLDKFCVKNIYATMNKDGMIYKFRGADVDKYAKMFIENKNLQQNVISSFSEKSFVFENPLSHCVRHDNKIYFKNFTDEKDEILWIGRKIRELILKNNYKFSDFAILNRTLKKNSSLFREIFKRLDIPIILQGMGGVFDEPKIIKITKQIKQETNTQQNIVDYIKKIQINENKKIDKFFETIANFSDIFQKIHNQDLTIEKFKIYLDEFWRAYTFETIIPDNNLNAVKITKIGDFKGQNNKIIFFNGASESIIPKNYLEIENRFKNLNKFCPNLRQNNYSDFLKQEQNIFNLAITRATDTTFITSYEKSDEKSNLKPSFFLKQIDLDFIEDNNDICKIQTKEELEFSEILNKIKTYEIPTKHKQKVDIKILKDILKNFDYSASSIKDYQKCSILFLLNRIAKIQLDNDKIAMEFGSICHKILERFHTKFRDYSDINSNNSKIFLENLIDEVFKENTDKFQGIGELKWYKNRAKKFLNDYLTEIATNEDFWQILELEKFLKYKLENINISGKIDRIDKISNNEIEILDYKTGKHKMTGTDAIRKKIEEGEEFQMLFYYILAKNFYPNYDISKLSYIWLEKTAKKSKKASFNIKDAKALEALETGKTNLIKLITDLQENPQFDFTAKDNNKCRNCPFEFICN